jgi:tRNA (cytidine/uridine-2'-O-)-methyltransferase
MKVERHIVLVAPEIHWNTGNIGRTCLAAGASLHLIEPLGFSLSERQVKRAGLDYWHKVRVSVWPDFDQWLDSLKPDIEIGEMVLLSKSGRHPIWSMDHPLRQFLVFGSETGGIPQSLLERYRSQTYHIPIRKDIRSLNLSTAVGIALYESLRRSGFTTDWPTF